MEPNNMNLGNPVQPGPGGDTNGGSPIIGQSPTQPIAQNSQINWEQEAKKHQSELEEVKKRYSDSSREAKELVEYKKLWTGLEGLYTQDPEVAKVLNQVLGIPDESAPAPATPGKPKEANDGSGIDINSILSSNPAFRRLQKQEQIESQKRDGVWSKIEGDSKEELDKENYFDPQTKTWRNPTRELIAMHAERLELQGVEWEEAAARAFTTVRTPEKLSEDKYIKGLVEGLKSASAMSYGSSKGGSSSNQNDYLTQDVYDDAKTFGYDPEIYKKIASRILPQKED